jgi:ArsR family transcriptional regulator, arsenate/arsenite/antimonite-responsive transcriptional repressor
MMLEISKRPEAERDERRAAMFRALGDPTRLRIFQFLRGCRGPVSVDEAGAVRRVEGATVGEVCCRVTGGDRITSTLSHHLKELRLAGLITTERQGRHVLCRVDPEAVAALAAFLAGDLTGDLKGETDDDCCG